MMRDPAARAVRRAQSLRERRERLRAELAQLDEQRLGAVVELRTLGKSHTEIGQLLGITKGRVQQLCVEAEQRGLLDRGTANGGGAGSS